MSSQTPTVAEKSFCINSVVKSNRITFFCKEKTNSFENKLKSIKDQHSVIRTMYNKTFPQLNYFLKKKQSIKKTALLVI